MLVRVLAWAILNGYALLRSRRLRKRLKALHLHQGTVAWGHSVFELLEGLPEEQRLPAELLDGAKVLDRFHIPSRYADAHPSGPPYRYYTPCRR